MQVGLFQNARSQMQRAFRLSTDVNTFYTACILLLHCSSAFFVAAITPFIVRRFALPSSIRNEVELNLSFNTCFSELHGICSFPTATVEFEKGTLFSPSVHYALSVRLQFADIEQVQKLGMFQNVLSIYDGEELLRKYTKSSYLRKPTFITKMAWVLFFPLYFVGMFHNYNIIEVPLAMEHIEADGRSSSKLVFQLQDRFAQIDNAVLVIDARFGIIRHLLYNWPLTTSSILFVSSLLACCFLIVVYWGTRSLVVLSRASEGSREHDVVSAKLTSWCLQASAPADEYLPDNVDEVPSSLDFTDIPGWRIQSSLKDVSHMERCCNVRLGAHKVSMVSPGPLLGDATSLPSLCHGFCGRYKLPAGNDSGTETIWSECGPCKWGNGAVDHRVCSPCQSELSPYDWLFLLFMAILPLLVHCFCVHWHTPKN
ncbi:putative adipose-regulatory protein, partial [Ostertagia ostertagi]